MPCRMLFFFTTLFFVFLACFSVAGLSLALNQMSYLSSEQRCGGVDGVVDAEAPDLVANRPQSNWSLPPIQSHKIDKLVAKMQNQEKFWEVSFIFQQCVPFVSFK